MLAEDEPMSRMSGLVVFLMAFGWCSASAESQSGQSSSEARSRRMPNPLTISKVAARPKMVHLTRGGTVTVSFSVNRSADVAVRIYNQQQALVRTLAPAPRSPGPLTVQWDGRDDAGKLCGGQWFIYTIEATDEDGHRVIYDPTEATGGQELQARKFVLDRKDGRMSYVLPKAAMVRIRIGLKDGPLLRTLVDWEPQLAGQHQQRWDGKDASGIWDLSDHPRLDVNLSAYSLPANAIITDAGPESIPKRPGREAVRRTPRRADRPNGWYYHWTHDPAICHEPRFSVTFPGIVPKAGSNVPVLPGKTPVRIEADPRDKRHLVNRRFEAMLYVDGVFLYEDENASNPFTYQWDTSRLAAGPHALTVNVMSYDDHIGVVTRQVMIGE